MRNGNFVNAIENNEKIPCSYPTYEEWKPVIIATIPLSLGCSYPTYEEWKRKT